MARDPSADLVLTPLEGRPRTAAQQLTTFHLLLVALDPFTNESAWVLPAAARVLATFQQADCRVAWLVTGTADQARQFLGPWTTELVTFVDPERTAVKEFGLERLPALVHLGMDGRTGGVAEGWDPTAWREVTDRLARVLHWKGPSFPGPKDPGPFVGTPALG